MAGLDTRGAFDGFVKGFGMMQGYQDSKDRKEHMKDQQAMQQRGLEMREQEFSARQDDRQRQQDQQQIAQFYNGWASGVEAPITPELEQVFERNKLADPRHLFKPDTQAAVQYADALSKGEGSLFSQETVDAMNTFYSPRVNRGAGGKKRLAGMYPGQKEGSFVFELEVEDEQGNKRNAPMTMNRGMEGEDDEVAQYDIEQAIGPVMGAKSIYQALGDNREKMMAYLQSSGFLPKEEAKWEQVQGPGGSILQRNTATGELKNVLGRAPQAAGSGGGSYGNPTSQQKNFLFLRDALKLTDEEAYKVAFGGTGAVNDRVSDRVMKGISLLNTQIKEIDSTINTQGMMLEEEELSQLNAARQELVQQRDMLASGANLFDAPGDGMPQLGQPQQQQQQQQSQQAQPEQQQGAQPSPVDDEIRKLNLW